jgi:nicotinamidase-related amidase
MPDSTAALLIIDVQEDSLVGCDGASAVIERINALAREATAAGVPVIAIQHNAPEDGLVRDTPEWQLAAALELPPEHHLVHKTFRDAFADTELEPLLERLGVERLIVTGLHSDFCVQMSALSAVVRGYDLTFVSDAHATLDSAAFLGAQISALVNSRMEMLRHPGRTIEVVPATEVSWQAHPLDHMAG